MKKALPAAIALAGSMGFAAAANAVNVNHEGLGQVLLYSYYTVEDGNDTLVNITNTTDEVIAVKVRFVEAMNSQEVLDFNLYLSPYDVWTGAVTAGTTAAKLITPDKSCTVPAIPSGGVDFRNFQYQGTSYSAGKGGPQGLDRTRTGYLEVIEMGVVNNLSTTIAPASWATHINGVPANCAGIAALWNAGAPWTNDPTAGMSAPIGGLFGSAILVNVEGGTDISYDAVALDNFSTSVLHAPPGTTNPSLNDAEPFFALPDGTTGTTAGNLRENADAVSAVLQVEQIANDYLTVEGLAATTDWVVTFPTKRFYVNGWTPTAQGGVSTTTASPEPFTNFWTSAAVGGVAGSACEAVNITYWDQEEREEAPSGPDFSPAPPGAAPFALCWEANVVGVNGSTVLGGGYTHSNIDLLFDAGWMNVDFTNGGQPLQSPANGVSYTRQINTTAGYINGLPTIGFAATQFVNGDVGGLLSNYAGSTLHKATVTSLVTAP